MFARMRTDLGNRLNTLRSRYLEIRAQALVELDEAQFAQRRFGCEDDQTIVMLQEISAKTQEQAKLCDEAIYGLFVDRVNPLIFRRSVKKAERFADQCEAVIVSIATEKLRGKELARARFGGST